MTPPDVDVRNRIDEALVAWRQGDCVIGEQWFAFRTDVSAPLTADAMVAAEEGVDLAETKVYGFMVVTQTCDIVRGCGDRPFVEVCPLVEVDAAMLGEIKRCRRPSYACVPTLTDRRLVADLDRVMTVEKSVVAGWERVAGWHDTKDARSLALMLARKRARVAFPDDFVAFVAPLMTRMSSKHDKSSDEGRALKALKEVRVRATPSWDDLEVRLIFWFIHNESEPSFEGQPWTVHLEGWEKLIKPRGRFVDVQSTAHSLDDLTARDYVESDPLDLDYLTFRGA